MHKFKLRIKQKLYKQKHQQHNWKLKIEEQNQEGLCDLRVSFLMVCADLVC